ncbi:3-deoxy-D-manno-octulosonic acid transferase [Limnobacter sp.]|uniref:3-deoxy-D-manno-octulosonic acid transferase n=1 Tax=Limnobacter sp. TaxID=2003368 RepID=UPI003512192D
MRPFLFFYSLVLLILQPVLALYLLKRAVRQRAYLSGWGMRFLARVPDLRGSNTGSNTGVRRIWVHAVSVGESHAVSPLVKHWHKVYPNDQWVFTCTTPTGMDTCKSLYASLPGVQFAYLPYDLPWLVSRCIRRLNASALWVVETELWPNLFLKAKARGLHTALLNARVSPTTGKRLMQLGAIARPVVQSLGALLVQTPADGEVFAALGRAPDGVHGNLKFDVALRPDLASKGKQWRAAIHAQQVLLFASSREGEEALLLDALNRTQFFKRMPGACVWIVPRHPQRFDEVFEQMVQAATRMGVARPLRRSTLFAEQASGAVAQPSAPLGQPRLVLGDSMGEMPAYYSVADLALLGGSWLPLGGQNLIEACAYGCPVWMGPHTFNFAKAAQDALSVGAARRFEHIQAACEQYLAQHGEVDASTKAAFAYARSHRGATQRSFDTLRALLPPG